MKHFFLYLVSIHVTNQLRVVISYYHTQGDKPFSVRHVGAHTDIGLTPKPNGFLAFYDITTLAENILLLNETLCIILLFLFDFIVIVLFLDVSNNT